MTPKISIITLTYNHEKFIRECIESVLSQSYSNWEQIIIDDASTDKTAEIIEQYVKKDRRIKFLRHRENFGISKLADTYNEALGISTGDFIAILEGDDIWTKEKLKRQIQAFEDPDVVLAYGSAAEIRPDGVLIWIRKTIIDKRRGAKVNNPIGRSLRIFYNLEDIFYTVSVMFRRSSLIDIGGFIKKDYLPLVDYPTYLRLTLEGKFSIVRGEILGYWRRYKGSICFNNIVEMKKGLSRSFLDFIEENSQKLLSLGIKFDKDKIKNHHRSIIEAWKNKVYLTQGKYFIYFNDWASAEQSYLKAFLNSKHFIYRMLGLFAWLFAKVRIDFLEPIARYKRRLNYVRDLWEDKFG